MIQAHRPWKTHKRDILDLEHEDSESCVWTQVNALPKLIQSSCRAQKESGPPDASWNQVS
jgi:hypothetical protein